jgi:hypothetical protein
VTGEGFANADGADCTTSDVVRSTVITNNVANFM